MDQVSSYVALSRFGLGRRGLEALPGDPAAWLEAQLGDGAGPAAAPLAAGFAALREVRASKPAPGQPNAVRALFQADVAALAEFAAGTEAPFRERLVRFWTNHFTVSVRGGPVAAFAGDFVASAIRPHATGRFEDMLLAVMRHPAMLLYLNQAGSVGPDSPVGRRGHRGLNENLARESLELHTVGVDGGYTQTDVTNYARILTGWSLNRRPANPGFLFRPMTNEPGEKVLMGRRFPPGEQGGVEALAFLAGHPATHRHLASKLVQHFVADAPASGDVRVVEGVLRDSGGDLGAAARAVVRLPGAWRPLAKLRAPQDYLFAAVRAAGLMAPLPPIAGGLGQPFFGAPLPNGWGDTAADWAGPEAVLRRVDWAYGYAARPGLPEPDAMAEAALGPLVRPATLAAIHRAGSRRDAMTLLLSAPEFQRR